MKTIAEMGLTYERWAFRYRPWTNLLCPQDIFGGTLFSARDLHHVEDSAIEDRVWTLLASEDLVHDPRIVPGRVGEGLGHFVTEVPFEPELVSEMEHSVYYGDLHVSRHPEQVLIKVGDTVMGLPTEAVPGVVSTMLGVPEPALKDWLHNQGAERGPEDPDSCPHCESRNIYNLCDDPVGGWECHDCGQEFTHNQGRP